MEKKHWSHRFRRMNGYSWGAVFFICVGFVIFAVGLAKQQGPTAALGGACVAISGTLFGLWTQSRKEKIDASKFYLESALDGLEQAVELMGELEKTRWITASNMLIHIRDMQHGIEEEEHKNVFRMNSQVRRSQIAHALGYKKAEPWMYFGKKTEGIYDELYHAARASTTKIDHPAVASADVASYFSLKSLAIIYSFVKDRPPSERKFPGEIVLEGYFPEADLPRMKFLYPGLHQYIEMHENFYFSDGKIFRDIEGSEMHGTEVTINDLDFMAIAHGPTTVEELEKRYPGDGWIEQHIEQHMPHEFLDDLDMEMENPSDTVPAKP